MTSALIHIDAPAETVWAMVSDVTRVGEWSPETVSAEWLDGATRAAVGATFKGHNRRKGRWSTTCRVTAADPGRAFAFVVGKDETAWRYQFAPAGGGCDVTESFEILKVPGRIARALTKAAVGVGWEDREEDLLAGMQETLRRLKAAAEA